MKLVFLVVLLLPYGNVSAQNPTDLFNFIIQSILGYGNQGSQPFPTYMPSWFQSSLPSWILPYLTSLLPTQPEAPPTCNFFPDSAGYSNADLRALAPLINSMMCSLTTYVVNFSQRIQLLLQLIVKIYPQLATKEEPEKTCTEKPLDIPSLYVGHVDGNASSENPGLGHRIQLYDRNGSTYTLRPEEKNSLNCYGVPSVIVTNRAGDRLYTAEYLIGIGMNTTIYGWDSCLGKFTFRYTKVQTVGRGDAGSALVIDSTDRYLIQIDSGVGVVYVERIEPGDTLTRTHTEPLPSGCNDYDVRNAHIEFHPTIKNLVAVSYDKCKKIVFYKFDDSTGTLSKIGSAGVEINLSGNGRISDFVFTPNGNFMYVANAINFKIIPYSIQQSSNMITSAVASTDTVKSISSSDTISSNSLTKIKITPNGKVLYAINDDHNDFLIFRIKDQSKSKLTLLLVSIKDGEDSEFMTMSPDGARLFVAYYGSKHIIPNIIREDGTLLEPKTIPNYSVTSMLATNK